MRCLVFSITSEHAVQRDEVFSTYSDINCYFGTHSAFGPELGPDCVVQPSLMNVTRYFLCTVI